MPNDSNRRLAPPNRASALQPRGPTAPLFRPARTTGTPIPAASGIPTGQAATTSTPAHSLPPVSAGSRSNARVSATSGSNQTRTHARTQTRLTVDQPTAMPVTPRKGKLVVTSENDEEGDTEPEDDTDGILGSHALAERSAPTQSGPRTPTSTSSKPAPLGRTPTPGSLAAVLRRSQGSGAVFPQGFQTTPSAPLPTAPPPLPTSAKPSPTPVTRSMVTPESKPQVAHETASSSAQTHIGQPRPRRVQPEAGPSRPPGGARFRECTFCHGSGRVPISESETDSAREGQDGVETGRVLKKRVSSLGIGGRPRKRLSDAHRQGDRDGHGQVDKGKGKARERESEVCRAILLSLLLIQLTPRTRGNNHQPPSLTTFGTCFCK